MGGSSYGPHQAGGNAIATESHPTDESEFWTTRNINWQQVETSRGPVEYADVGEGLPILYFHGIGAGGDAAVIMERSLLDDGFRLIVPNRPGYYGTPITSGRSLNDCADLAAELLDYLGIKRAVVVGTSGGGMSAPRFAERHPAKAAALVLQCAVAHPLISNRWMPRHLRWLSPIFRHPRAFRTVLRFGFRREMRKLQRDPNQMFRQMCGQRLAEICDDPATCALIPLLVDSELRCSKLPSGIENDWINIAGAPWLTPGSVRCPTLILHDRADPMVPSGHLDWARDCIPDAEICDLHAGGHLIWVGSDGQRMRSVRAAFIRRHFEQRADSVPVS